MSLNFGFSYTLALKLKFHWNLFQRYWWAKSVYILLGHSVYIYIYIYIYKRNWYQLQIMLQVMKLFEYYITISSWFKTYHAVRPEGGIFVPKYVAVVSLLFICIWHCALVWFKEQIHRPEVHGLDNFKIKKNTRYVSSHEIFNFLDLF